MENCRWCAEARFYYKPEPSWLRTMWQRVRWQPGTLAGFVIALTRPEEMRLIGHSWGAPYRLLCLCEVTKIVLCCSSNIIWALVTEFGFRTNPLPVGLLHGTVVANIIFPVLWSAWACLIGFEVIGTGDPTRENFFGTALSRHHDIMMACCQGRTTCPSLAQLQT